jgi:hypothetical protein
MESLAIAIALCCPCPAGPTVTVTPTAVDVSSTNETTRRHPIAHAVKTIGKGVNHLRPFRGHRRGC